MQIAINNRRIELQYKTVLAVQYDNGTEFVDFVLDRTQYDEDLSDLTPLFLYENAAGGFIDAATKTVTDSQIIVRWLIGKHLTNVAGELSFMLVLASCEDITQWQDATRIWQTEKARCTIPPSILATEPFDPEAPLISQLIALAAQINETIGNADQILQDMTKIKDGAQAIVDNFTAEDVVFTDGQTFQQKYEAGDLDGPPGEQGKEGAGLSILGTLESTTELPVAGAPGQAYMIGGNLYVWTLAENTWINAGKIKGDPGDTPEIGENGHWWISGVDTGISATGEKGDKGDTPAIGDNGHWFIGDTDTGFQSAGPPGDPGKSATITVGTVTTGEPGSSAAVTNSGTEADAVLDFVIPQGASGGGAVNSNDILEVGTSVAGGWQSVGEEVGVGLEKVEGKYYLNKFTGYLYQYRYNGESGNTEWIWMGSTAGCHLLTGTAITGGTPATDSSPSNHLPYADGDLYLNTDTLNLYRYFEDNYGDLYRKWALITSLDRSPKMLSVASLPANPDPDTWYFIQEE